MWWQDTAPGPVLPTDEIDARRITRTSDAGHHADLPERTRRCRALGPAAFLCAWRQGKHAGRQSGVAVRQLPPSGRPEDTGGACATLTSAENQQSVEQHQFGWRTGGATRFGPPGPRGGARNGGRRTPRRGLRARAGSSSNLGHVKAIVPWSPDKGRSRIGTSAHISPCVSPPPGRAQSLRPEQRMRGMAQPESAKPQLGESGRQHDGSRR